MEENWGLTRSLAKLAAIKNMTKIKNNFFTIAFILILACDKVDYHTIESYYGFTYGSPYYELNGKIQEMLIIEDVIKNGIFDKSGIQKNDCIIDIVPSFQFTNNQCSIKSFIRILAKNISSKQEIDIILLRPELISKSNIITKYKIMRLRLFKV
jgi:hypothetical protein